jgi:type III secretion system YscD/HrpQ family protein
VLAIVSLALLTLVGTAMAVGLHLLQPDENLEESARQQVDAVVASLQMPTVSVAQEETRGIFVEGFVASNEQLALLGRTLAELPFPVKVRVASLEQQATAMRTIAAHTGANLAIEPNPKTGAIRVSGLLPDAGTFATLKQMFERDIANLRPIEEQIVSVDSAAAEVATLLSGAGLDVKTRVDSVDDEIRISGVVPEVAKPALRDIVAKAGQRWSPPVKIVDATTTAPVPPPKVASAQAPMPYEDVAMVVVGKNSFFYDRKGQRHAVGDRLSNGDVIDEISAEEVVVKRGDVRMRYPVTRRY